MKRIIINLIILLVIIPNVLALQSEEYIDEITKVVFSGCNGTDIKLKENFFIRADNKGFILDIKWPYEKGLIKSVIQYISSSEPYAVTSSMYMGGEITLDGKIYKINNKGENILVCGKNYLEVFGRDYLWNEIRIPFPRETVYISTIEPEQKKLSSEGLSPAQFEARMAKSERKAFWIGIFIALFAGFITNFIIMYIFADKIKRNEIISYFKKIKKKFHKNPESPE